MKRLLLGPALIAPLALFGCNWGTKVPEVPEVVGSVSSAARQIPLEDFEHFPPVKIPDAAPAPVKIPKVKPHVHAVQPRAARPTPKPVLPPVAKLPPQQGPICIFPLNMIPNCTPQAVAPQ